MSQPKSLNISKMAQKISKITMHTYHMSKNCKDSNIYREGAPKQCKKRMWPSDEISPGADISALRLPATPHEASVHEQAASLLDLLRRRRPQNDTRVDAVTLVRRKARRRLRVHGLLLWPILDW